MKQKNIVLMVVAVGCGLVAAFLTSQMSAKPAAVEKVDVIVAAKDLTVGTSYTKEDLKNVLKRKSVAKDAVPSGIIEAEEELLEKRLSRTIRAEEMINKADLSKGVFVSIPPGMAMVSLPINLQNSVHGFVLPGSKVDVIASVTLSNKVRVMPILVNMLVLAVDANVQTANGQGTFQSVSTVSFAVTGKQALLIQLARARHCEMTLVLRNQEDKISEHEKGYEIDKVVSLLERGEIQSPGGGTGEADGQPKNDNEPKEGTSPAPKTELVKVPAAADDIAAGTQLTKDLIATKFKLVELPKDLAADAVTDLEALANDKQTLRTGLGKGQWITKSLVGKAEPKPAPRDEFEPKPGPAPAKNIRVVTRHTAEKTTEFRYEEVAVGEWKFLGEYENGKLVEREKKQDKTPTPEKVD
ncbi:MAG: Flp pilus assembly protein CpaB [Gemmataceae bacterium]